MVWDSHHPPVSWIQAFGSDLGLGPRRISGFSSWEFHCEVIVFVLLDSLFQWLRNFRISKFI